MADDLFWKHQREREGSQRDYDYRKKNQEAANKQFRSVVSAIGRDAAIARGQEEERQHRREYRESLSAEMTSLKSRLLSSLEACPFPAFTSQFRLGSSVKDEWQHALETIDPMASDGEVRLKQLLVQVEAYRNASGPFRATSSAFDDAASARQRIAQRQRLTASLELLEVHLKSLIRYAGWWRTA